MGACHSQLAIEADGFNAFDPVVKSPRRRGPKALKISIPSPGKSSKNRIVRLVSPSEDTAPITPASIFSNPPHENDLCGISPMAPLQALREYEEASFSSSDASSTSSYTRLFKSNKNKTDMGQSVIKSVITEEAPSNENESHEIKVQEIPKSTIYRPTAPLVAPPKGAIVSDTLQKPLKASVSPHTITDFNKLKLQVQVAAKTEKMKKHKEKLQDRHLDVKGYRNLWNSFEKMKLEVEEASANKENALPDDDDASTMSLKEPDTWFFDFNNSSRNYSLAMDDDIQSTVSFSMLSEVNLETQRKFYREKSKQRQNKKPNRYKHKGPLQERQGGYNNSNSSFGSFSTKQSAISDYGPIKRVASMSTLSISGFNETGTTFSSENSREVDRSGSIVSDLERNNDYNVARRQRQKVVDVSSQREIVSSLLESATNYNSDSSQDNDSYGSGFINDEYTNSALKRSVPDSPSRVQQYGFDPSAPLSSQLDIFAMPSIEIEESMTGVVRWREFEKDDKKPSRKLDFGANATPKKGNVSTETESSEIPVDEVEETSSKKDKALQIKTNLQTLEVNPFWDMSSEHFLMMSTPRSLLDSDKEEQDEKKALYESFSNMSTEQFMMMSTFKSPSPQDLESDEDYTSRTEDNDLEPSNDAGEVESTTESPESSTVDGSEPCEESDPYLDAVTSHSETMASPNPDSAASEDLDNAIDLMDAFDFWDIERRRLSIDQCDELANQVSGQLSSLLRRFREDNRR